MNMSVAIANSVNARVNTSLSTPELRELHKMRELHEVRNVNSVNTSVKARIRKLREFCELCEFPENTSANTSVNTPKAANSKEAKSGPFPPPTTLRERNVRRQLLIF